jgi:hypothetical protein
MLKNSGYASHTFAFITLKYYAFCSFIGRGLLQLIYA